MWPRYAMDQNHLNNFYDDHIRIIPTKFGQNPLGAFCNTFDLHLVIICIENQFLMFLLSGHLRQVLL